MVSTHSRPKAAGRGHHLNRGHHLFQLTAARRRLGCTNTRPNPTSRFNSQPPEGGWAKLCTSNGFVCVSTHSRPKAAGYLLQ